MRLLVIRTSSMGDVALTAPVLKGMMDQYPDAEIILLTRPAFGSFFKSFSRLQLIYTDLKNRHGGLTGVIRLFRDIRHTGRIDIIIDLHDVLRSKILLFLFRLTGVPSFVIDKGRREKRLLTSGKKKVRLKHSVERYYDTFARAGFPLKMTGGPWIIPSTEALKSIASLISGHSKLNIGIAPYAKHELKMWPEEYMIRLLELISMLHKAEFFLFGGDEEAGKLAEFRKRLTVSASIAGGLNLDEELALMSRLDFMIAMDSSNMHMAALVGVKVISIWGGTDPLLGFGAWLQPEENFIRIPIAELTCRPCTVYGRGKCRRGDLACMNWLTPEMVYRRITDSGIL